MTERPVWHVAWKVLVTMVLVTGGRWLLVAAEVNHHYAVSELCRNHFLQQLHRVVDGATVFSNNERNLNCQLTFQTESILQRFMVRFDYLQLDCNDHLYIHDGAHVIDGKYKAELSCRNTQQSVGTLYMRSNYITLEYRTDSWGTEKNGFKLVITAYKRLKKPNTGECTELVCGEHCVSSDLACDGITHCPDGLDETVAAGCANGSLGTLLGMDRTVLTGAVAGLLLMAVLVLVALTVCLCRRRRQRRPDHAANNANNSLHTTSVTYTNGGGTSGAKLSENFRVPTVWTGYLLRITTNIFSNSLSSRPSLSTTDPPTPVSVAAEVAVRRRSGSSRGRSLCRDRSCRTDPGPHLRQLFSFTPALHLFILRVFVAASSACSLQRPVNGQ